MKYLLDTCFLSEFTRPQPEVRLLRWLETVAEPDLCLSALTLGEIQRGIARLPESARRANLQNWLTADLQQRFTGRILPLDAAVMLLWGELTANLEQRGLKMLVIDSLIAATARCHNLTIVTRNTADFVHCGAALFNPWHFDEVE